MTLYFAYGSNMSRAVMRRHCPAGKAIGTAALSGYRFIITVDGYASIVPHPGGIVQGVLWRLAPRDLAALNSYEGLDSGLYVRMTLPVTSASGRVAAMVYVARRQALGRPRPGYLDLVVDAARDWALPPDYVSSLARWRSGRWRGARAIESGEVA
jgi:gamma-glutamylcyclotransferase (GGCT)/AIG2-like uncharacterized protein YtfP